MRLNVNPQRLRNRRRSTDRWLVRQDGAEVYRGHAASEAWRYLFTPDNEYRPDVQVLLYGRQVWPPADELPLNQGHL